MFLFDSRNLDAMIVFLADRDTAIEARAVKKTRFAELKLAPLENFTRFTRLWMQERSIIKSFGWKFATCNR